MLNIKEKIFTFEEINLYLKDINNPYPQTEDFGVLFYLDFINNFLTIKEMGEAYYMSKIEALNWFRIGKFINKKRGF